MVIRESTYRTNGLSWHCREDDAALYLRFEGDLRAQGVRMASASLADVLTRQWNAVFVDLSGVSSIDPRGVELLHQLNDDVEASGGKFEISSMSFSARHMIALGGPREKAASGIAEAVLCPVCDAPRARAVETCPTCGSAV